jgi:hypothetical protein
MNGSVYKRAGTSAQDDDAANLAIADALHEAGLAEQREHEFIDVGADETADTRALCARCRLKEARQWFEHRGWDVLPQSQRGRRILRWGADQAWLAAGSDGNPKRSVRNWCRKWAPWLTAQQLDKIVTDTEKTNKRWSADQCATVLEITLSDRSALKFRFIGASDDPDLVARTVERLAKAAARARRYRAAKGSGTKRGPKSKLSPEERLARRRAQDAKRAMRLRASRKKPSRHIESIGERDEISVTQSSLTSPWKALGLPRSTYYKRRAAGTLPPPPPPWQARPLNVEGLDLAKFGIVAIRVMQRGHVMASWQQMTRETNQRGVNERRCVPD